MGQLLESNLYHLQSNGFLVATLGGPLDPLTHPPSNGSSCRARI